MSHSRVSPAGRLMGKSVARLADLGQQRLEEMGLDGVEGPGLRGSMCKTCACRPGTVPNGCLQTQMDFMKAASDGLPFLCHAPMNGQICAGWARVRAELVANPLPTEVMELLSKHEYSPADDEGGAA